MISNYSLVTAKLEHGYSQDTAMMHPRMHPRMQPGYSQDKARIQPNTIIACLLYYIKSQKVFSWITEYSYLHCNV